MLQKIKLLFTNKVMQYVIGRYLTYLIQFINSIFIAVLLGPFYLGIWGFITLILQYFNLINLGIPLSLNTLASIEKDDSEYVSKVFNTSNAMLVILSLFIGLLFFFNFTLNLDLGSKFSFSKYAFPIFLILFVNNILNNFMYIYRIYGRIFEIAFNQTVFPVLMIICLVFFRGEKLLLSLVWTNVISFILSLILYVVRSPVKLKWYFEWEIAKIIQKKGWFLFLFTSSFYFILISVRTVISKYYNVNEFGYFTFAFSLANVILLLFQSFATLVFPKILNKLAKSTDEEGLKFIHKIRNSYIGLSHLLVHVVIFGFPLFLFFFSKYAGILSSFRYIVLTLVLFTSTLGYQDLLIARGKERSLSRLSFVTLVINVIIAFVFVKFKFPYQYIILSTTIAMLFFSFVIGKDGTKLLGLKYSFIQILFEVFPISILIPYLSSLVLLFFNASNLFFAIPCLLYIGLNINNLKASYFMLIDLIKRPNMINF